MDEHDEDEKSLFVLGKKGWEGGGLEEMQVGIRSY